MESVGRLAISVIMLTYNRENLVGRAIKSILCQTFRNFEFIIVDNGSLDQSGVIADKCAEQDSRIHVIHRERGNIGSGRNAGLDIARGEYITFIDDDDWCEPDFLEFLYTLAIENNADVSICGATDKAFDKKIIMNAEESLIELLWRKYYNVQFPTKLIAYKLFAGKRFSEKSKYDDIELMPHILVDAKCIAYHGLPKYTFYRHKGNNSAWTTNYALLTAENLDEYLCVYHERTQLLCNIFPDKAATWQYFEWSFMISMLEKLKRLDAIKNYEKQLNAIHNELKQNKDIFMSCDLIQEFERVWVNEHV